MKSYSAIIVVVVVLVFGDVHGRVASSVVSQRVDDVEVGVQQCPYNAIPNTIMTVPFLMLLKGQDCVMPSAAFQRKLDAANDTASYRRLFQRACLQEGSAKSCLSRVLEDAPSCLNKMETMMIETVFDTVNNTTSATCDSGSVNAARVYGDELSALSEANQMRVVACVFGSGARTLFDREVDIPAHTMRRYRALREGRDCALEVAKKEQVNTTQFEEFMGRVINGMKCISPVTEEIVYCEALVLSC